MSKWRYTPITFLTLKLNRVEIGYNVMKGKVLCRKRVFFYPSNTKYIVMVNTEKSSDVAEYLTL